MRTHGGIMPPWYVESINLHASRPLGRGADGSQIGVNAVPSLSR